jgi:hypothetical protein
MSSSLAQRQEAKCYPFGMRHTPETCPVPLEQFGIADTFAESGPYTELLDKYGLNVRDIVTAVRRVCEQRDSARSLSEQLETSTR